MQLPSGKTMRTLKGGRKSQAGEHCAGAKSRKRMRLDGSLDPYQKRVFFVSEPTSSMYDVVKGGFQRKNLLGNS